MLWRSSDIEDYKKFPNYHFEASETPFYFFETKTDFFSSRHITTNNKEKVYLKDVLEKSGTTAFIIIKKDTLICEEYFNDYNRASVNTSFSVAKSITSLIIGKAIEEGIIKRLNDPVTDYLPSLSQVDTKYSEVQISHLLDMKSGISFVDHDLPWGDKPKAYYYPDLRNRVKELPVHFTPGTRFEYNSYNPILLGMILEEASQITPAEYFEEKIWNKLEMEFSGSWSMDSKGSGMTKMESGLNLRAIDLAKFGRLVLREGNWEGEQIISQSWLKSSFDIKDEDKVKKFGENIYYKNFWWLYANDAKEVEIISAWGHLGQYLFIFPEEEIIVVRMGKEKGDVDSWGNIFKEIVKRI